MMDIEKLIEQLSIRGLGNGTSLGYHSGLFDEAATALSAQQDENEKLRAELEQKSKLIAQQARMMGYEIIEDDCDQTATDSNQEAKSDGGKPRPSLVPPALIRGVDAIREYGCKKYSDPENWRRVEPQRYWEATLRHALAAWDNWQAVDEESGMPAIWHMACNLSFLMQYMEDGNG